MFKRNKMKPLIEFFFKFGCALFIVATLVIYILSLTKYISIMKTDLENVERDMDLVQKSVKQINTNLEIARDIAVERAEALTTCAKIVAKEIDSLVAKTNEVFSKMPIKIWG